MNTAPEKRHIVLRTYDILSQFAAFLILGTVTALIWANINPEGYHHFIENPLFYSNLLSNSADNAVSLHFLVNDLFMCLFFGIAMKEVSESMLPKGELSSFRKAAMPALATIGGVLGPIAVFFILHRILAPEPAFAGAWAIPTATDIAYCWIAAGILFGKKHPAVTFLLVLAVLDDLIGMIIIATFYTAELHLQWLGLVDISLFSFGLTNAGVLLNLSAFASKPTWIILLSLLIGKTLGIFSFSSIGRKIGLQLPDGVSLKQTLAVGMIAGIGFTVALFVTSVYVTTHTNPAMTEISDQLKLGALLSFIAAPLGYCLAKILKVQRRN